jgi:hypothetical protein
MFVCKKQIISAIMSRVAQAREARLLNLGPGGSCRDHQHLSKATARALDDNENNNNNNENNIMKAKTTTDDDHNDDNHNDHDDDNRNSNSV